MGFLNFFSKKAPKIAALPTGSFTIDREGQVIASTLSREIPEFFVKAISQIVLTTFRSGAEANLALSEIVFVYAAFKMTAREMRGGAVIYLTPQTRTRAADSGPL